jgi:multidrug resistance efflux pump
MTDIPTTTPATPPAPAAAPAAPAKPIVAREPMFAREPAVGQPRPSFATRLGRGLTSFLVGTLKRLATLAAFVVFGLAVYTIWQVYVASPWTRDGRIRVKVASVAPEVSGQIVIMNVVDNQFVHKGDVLYEIAPYDYQIALAAAESEVKAKAVTLQIKRTQVERREQLGSFSSSEEKQGLGGQAQEAEAAHAAALVRWGEARIDLERTKVKSPVTGYVNNLTTVIGDFAAKGKANISIIDSTSYWIDAYFEETKLAKIQIGDKVEAALIGYPTPIEGRVDSITRGIATSNASTGAQGLPTVDPVNTWVRLAQRIPVRIRIEKVPPGVPLIAGMSATVTVVAANERPPLIETWGAKVAATAIAWTPDALKHSASAVLDAITPPERAPSDLTTNVKEVGPKETIPFQEIPPDAKEKYDPGALPLAPGGKN